MTAARRHAVLIGVMVVLLALTAMWSWRWQARQGAAAQRTADDLAEARILAEHIDRLRAQPAIAATKDLELKELGSRLESAATRARLADGAIDTVFPRPARPLKDTPFLEKPTDIAIRDVTLTQLVEFLHHVANDAGLTVRDLRLRAPRGDAASDTWDAEVTLTYLLYSPAAGKQPGG